MTIEINVDGPADVEINVGGGQLVLVWVDGKPVHRPVDEVVVAIENAVVREAKLEAWRRGIPFDANSPALQEKVDLAVAEALDEMGVCNEQ